jgi:hypothetical protein
MAWQPVVPEESARLRSVLKLSFHGMAAGEYGLQTGDFLCDVQTLWQPNKVNLSVCGFRIFKCAAFITPAYPGVMSCPLQTFHTAPADARASQDQQRPEPVALAGRSSVGCAKSPSKWIDFIFEMNGFHADRDQGRPKCILKSVI